MTTDPIVELQERAWSLHAAGRLEEALCALREALRLIEETDGPISADAANLLIDLAEIEMDRQNFAGALALAERALGVEQGLGDVLAGADAARIRIRTYDLAGSLHRGMGDYGCAEVALTEALAIACRQFGEESHETAQARNNLGVLRKYQGRFSEGIRLLRRALRTMVAIHGGDSRAACTVYHNLGGILHANGDFAKAALPGRRAWSISARLLGPDHVETILHAAAYAAILFDLGRLPAAERIMRRSLTIFRGTFGVRHFETASAIHLLGVIDTHAGRDAGAERRYRQALRILEEIQGRDTPDVALVCNNLGHLLSRQGRFDEALPVLERAARVLAGRTEAGHPWRVRAEENLDQAKRCLRKG